MLKNFFNELEEIEIVRRILKRGRGIK